MDKKQRKKTQIINIINERSDITTYYKYVKRMIS